MLLLQTRVFGNRKTIRIEARANEVIEKLGVEKKNKEKKRFIGRRYPRSLYVYVERDELILTFSFPFI